jgi:glutamate/tyrosine decarboxylase-like PLP-dependent enzyme
MDLREWLSQAAEEIGRWQLEYGAFDPHGSTAVADDEFGAAFSKLVGRLRDNYPFFHPRYAAQMLKPPHPAAAVGYLTAMLINPNNHALDGGPATAALEREAVDQLASMFGLSEYLGHLTTSGTIANLEALFVARETHPGRGVAHSVDAHFTHQRMCHVLGMESYPVPTDPSGRMNLEALEALLRTGRIGTVVLTVGTTGIGAVDPVHEVLALRDRYGVRVHVDAAYGGFFGLIADDSPDGVESAPFEAIKRCDSVTVDPHKHGLQPYGCGAVLFADPSVGRFYKHDSPYTYFTSNELHLGEISLECSRAGAAASALWLTFQLIPPTPDSLGEILRPCRRAALRWADLIAGEESLALFQRPDLDVITFLPRAGLLSEVDRITNAVVMDGMHAPPKDAVYVAAYSVTAQAVADRGHPIIANVPRSRILRSSVMKPENEVWVDYLHRRIVELVEGANTAAA